jgi:hypothetical protein
MQHLYARLAHSRARIDDKNSLNLHPYPTAITGEVAIKIDFNLCFCSLSHDIEVSPWFSDFSYFQ